MARQHLPLSSQWRANTILGRVAETAMTLASYLQSDDVLLHFDKAATHRFSEATQLQTLQATLEQLINQLGRKPSN